MLIEKMTISPEEAFARLRDLPKPFIASGLGPDAVGGRAYSFASADPLFTVKTEDGVTVVRGSGLEESFKDPFEALSRTLSRFAVKGPVFPFNSGAFGYFSYDLNGMIEPGLKRAQKEIDFPHIPEMLVGVYDPVFVHDAKDGKGYLVSVSGDAGRFNRFKDILRSSKDYSPRIQPAVHALRSNMTREEYLGMINAAKEYISSGDIYQINLSQMLNIQWEGDPFALYLSLLKNHPAPFSSLLDLGDFQIISNSPERLLKVAGGTVETSPIKGTRPRGSSFEKDLELIEELRSSVKERAEHVMIVDLERNDLGMISATGTVEVVDFNRVETYPHLHHMVSTIRGRLKPGVDSPAALKAVFPGGSVTGAPKIRAMEIIGELEKTPRGVYTGGIGWMDFSGDIDIAMAIRTAVYKKGTLYLHVGGGIVADSVPEEEYDETLLKAEDFLHSLGVNSRQ